MPATKISELMKVDRNTINNDLKFLYCQALCDYNLEDISLDEILEKQLVMLEAQRDRLGVYLIDAKDVTSKRTIERLIADIDFRVLTTVEKLTITLCSFMINDLKRTVSRFLESKI